MAYSETKVIIGGLAHVPILIFIANLIKGKFEQKLDTKQIKVKKEPIQVIELKESEIRKEEVKIIEELPNKPEEIEKKTEAVNKKVKKKKKKKKKDMKRD